MIVVKPIEGRNLVMVYGSKGCFIFSKSRKMIPRDPYKLEYIFTGWKKNRIHELFPSALLFDMDRQSIPKQCSEIILSIIAADE